MSARPPSPRSLRARGRATASRGSSGTGRTATATTTTTNTGVVVPAVAAAAAAAASAGVTVGTNDDEDELMTINENRNVGSGLGPSDTINEPNANSSNSSISSHSSSSSEAGSVHSDGEQHSALLLDDGSGTSGRHPMDASACNACSLALENNHGFQVVEHERPLVNGCEDMWSWNKRDRSKEVWLSRSDNRRVYFHPNWSKGTAGIRGTRVLNNGRYYWEISLSQRVFGTR
uniref:B30.2/SPRY domain-containing protein n=1 Tax=Anopheles maculatus TaxID=74869 RepID=A0A182S6M3_9DIPT